MAKFPCLSIKGRGNVGGCLNCNGHSQWHLIEGVSYTFKWQDTATSGGLYIPWGPNGKNSIVRKRDYELITKPAIGENALKILKGKEELGFQRTTKNNNSRIRSNSVNSSLQWWQKSQPWSRWAMAYEGVDPVRLRASLLTEVWRNFARFTVCPGTGA